MYDIMCNTHTCLYFINGYCMKDFHNITPNSTMCAEYKTQLGKG